MHRLKMPTEKSSKDQDLNLSFFVWLYGFQKCQLILNFIMASFAESPNYPGILSIQVTKGVEAKYQMRGS